MNQLEKLLKNIERLIPQVEREVKEFINSKPTNKKHIEHELDYLMTPFTGKQFNDLVKYYKTIDENEAKEYIELFKEIIN